MADVINLKTKKLEQRLGMRQDQQAAMAAAGTPKTAPEQAIELTARLLRNWPGRSISDAGFDALAEALQHWPLPVAEECVDGWLGIARSKIVRGFGADRKMEVRAWPPSSPEVNEWCEDLYSHCWKLANSPRHQPRPEPEKPEPVKTAEMKADVQAKATELTNRLRRSEDPIYAARLAAMKPLEMRASEHGAKAISDLKAVGKLDGKPVASAWWPLNNPDFVVDSCGSVVPRSSRYEKP